MMKKKKEYIWCLIEFPDGRKEWYCVSKLLRQALFLEKKINRYWKNTLIGCYINASTTEYSHDHQTRLTVGRIEKIKILSYRSHDWHWTRNQFVTPNHLMDFDSAYNYLKHDYSWYNKFAIWVALRYWHNLLLQNKIKLIRKKLHRKMWKLHKFIEYENIVTKSIENKK